MSAHATASQIGRAWANEILHTAELSPYELSTKLADDDVIVEHGVRIDDDVVPQPASAPDHGAGRIPVSISCTSKVMTQRNPVSAKYIAPYSSLVCRGTP